MEQVNSLRRALIADTPNVCPEDIIIHRNTTSYTDEYIVHRLSLVVFRGDDINAKGHIDVKGTNLMGADIRMDSKDLRVEHEHATILPIHDVGEEFKADVTFTRDTATRHARFGSAVAVGMKSTDENTHTLSFECLLEDTHEEQWNAAIDSLLLRLTSCKTLLMGEQ